MTEEGGDNGEQREDVYSNDTDFSDFMSEINDHFTTLVRESYKAPKDAMEEWQAFKAAVNWEEWFLLPLLGIYISLFMIVILCRNNVNVQMVIFTSIFVVVLCAQWINAICAENWESFATQDYFQDRGTFVAVFLCVPLLFIATVQLIIFLVLAGRTLVEVKKLEFAAARKKKEKDSTPSEEPSGANGSIQNAKPVGKKKKSKKDD